MVLPNPCRLPRRGRPRRAFTLIELITAASMMTLMMLGVVQIFGIITETASQAQGAAFAMEQGRALLDAMYRDIRGFDRTGYLKIQKSDTDASGVPGTYTDPGVPATAPLQEGVPVMSGANAVTWYSTDCLALTTVGYFTGQKAETNRATGAEVVYSSNVLTPDKRFTLKPSATPNVDPRRGVLARAVWLLGPTGGTTKNDSDISAAAVLADLGSGKTPDRLSMPAPEGADTVALAVSPVQITPLLTRGTTSTNFATTNLWQLRRVAACCISEFMVETFEDVASGSTTTPQWTRRAWTVVPIGPNSSASADKLGPGAIRVTIAIHDPADRKPSTGASGRYEGFALQEIFWFSDP